MRKDLFIEMKQYNKTIHKMINLDDAFKESIKE